MSFYVYEGKKVEIGIKICMGYELIFLDTNLKNTRAQYVYELLGFKKIAINENSWKNQLGELLQTSIDYELRPSDFCNAKLIG